MKRVLKIRSKMFTLIILCLSGVKAGTLTTASVRDDAVSLKPTTMYKRIIVDRNVERSTTILSIFQSKAPSRRSRVSEVWNWDYWCRLQAKSGDCSKSHEKYHYDAQLDRCTTFNYTGCKGNKNRFDTKVECERHCKGSGLMETRTDMRTNSCFLQPNTGLCLALFYRYYYDVNDKSCKSFVYGGCGGNENRFETRRSCLKYCKEGTEGGDSIED